MLCQYLTWLLMQIHKSITMMLGPHASLVFDRDKTGSVSVWISAQPTQASSFLFDQRNCSHFKHLVDHLPLAGSTEN